MNKTIIVSNRLPTDIKISNGKLQVKPSIGGLATGLKSVHAEGDSLWVGWPGLTDEELTPQLSADLNEALAAQRCIPVLLSEYEMENYYYGFSNKALWPLFHYFQAYTEFEWEQWQSYKDVNSKFADAVLEHAADGDTIWVHDYQLLLLPQMIRDRNPNITIGFFLHIPYPSYELFRTCPWRDELLYGMLGADLVGFHIYDYARHFLSSVSRISGLETRFNSITYNGRIIQVDSFPMGIDYNRFFETAKKYAGQPVDSEGLMQKLNEHNNAYPDSRLILSIDRMDYTKGIPNRIRAFEYFLRKYPEFRGKVRLLMLTVPSRENVQQYQKLKSETDELVGRINGEYATVNYMPVWYFYRAMPFEDLVGLYGAADVAFVTPVRDGMNLVAKEYVASRLNDDGVLVLSEMAGAAQELHQALLINPNNFEQIADTLKKALEMPADEQACRIRAMKQRLSRYNVDKWAEDFMRSLRMTKHIATAPVTPKLESGHKQIISEKYNQAQSRLLLLDYDGTLVGFKNDPLDAMPDKGLFNLLDSLAEDHDAEVAIISGRDRKTLENWFGNRNYTLVTDHGVWMRRKGNHWEELEQLKSDWKESIRPVMETFTDRTPGAFIEEKDYSLAWHYRRSDAGLAGIRAMELRHVLTGLTANNGLSVLEGNKVLEIKSSTVNKGKAAARLLAARHYDFVLAMGDDWTDEYMFEEMPDSAFTVKVGLQKTVANYYIPHQEVRSLLHSFSGMHSRL
ncbi:bifunctional alpha,alpha-trehalose-phosphate synthase (UDP-forming)/trehalose-phosphatase [uncultured Flavobacterium sp.]|uniref:bifunctional alpha,alpha-trehalose-phosphate synthase (UDP-forming)/trehalose-phosphatase n=1 Tax=uncultured Flavobacterium sp. TaxID=165435 RepID=UPI0025DCBD45|nr:bifunctional alpha,alpha-trehalose-phosphate synthase (UDP-forming)/trehalose-phosphatase [uncultured Flavobacterium sp.]